MRKSSQKKFGHFVETLIQSSIIIILLVCKFLNKSLVVCFSAKNYQFWSICLKISCLREHFCFVQTMHKTLSKKAQNSLRFKSTNLGPKIWSFCGNPIYATFLCFASKVYILFYFMTVFEFQHDGILIFLFIWFKCIF